MGHKSDDCWIKFGKPKRERSASTERRSSNSGRRVKGKKNPKHNSRQVVLSESATDKESAQSDTEVDETPEKEEPKHSSRKVRGIAKNKVRKTRARKKENSETRDKDLTCSASVSQLAALSGSGRCRDQSSEDLGDSEEEEIAEMSEKLIKRYQNKLKSHKIRRFSDNVWKHKLKC